MSKTKNSKPKISKVKTRNIQGSKRTKGKKTHSQSVVKARRKLGAIRKLKEKNRLLRSQGKFPERDETTAEEILDMLDSEELSFIRGIQDPRRQYIVDNLDPNNSNSNEVKRKRKLPFQDKDDLEAQYEFKYSKEMDAKQSVRVLLPTKSKHGFQEQTVPEDELEAEKLEFLKQFENDSKSNDIEPQNEHQNGEIAKENQPSNLVVSTAMLLAQRRRKLAEYRLKIGILSASFLEDPDNRMRNLDSLLAMLQTSDSAVSYSVPKLVAVSLLAVFQDVLPSYSIKHTNPDGVKLKKDTRDLQGTESGLLRRYKIYLQRLEKLVGKYVPRKRQKFSETESKLGFIALDCMCKMLTSHMYFNLATNIVNFIIPLLNNWNVVVRNIVGNAIQRVFQMDKRGEISYEIVRRINVLVKSKLGGNKNGMIRRDVIDVLLALRIKEADLEKEMTEEMTPNKKLTFEERRMLSKRQRKKAKDMVQLERELLEASAEENKARKSHFLTEITKIVFTIYFRALKTTPNPEMLSAVLEGLAKFAHIISIDYFDDLLRVIAGLQRSGNLKPRQSFLCVATVLAVLDGQGSSLTLDPTIFHKSLYENLISLLSGKNSNVDVAMKCIRLACGKKKVPGPRASAFVKRLAIVSLQLDDKDALGVLSEIKSVLRMNPATNGLLDSEGTLSDGLYKSELSDPDHCGAKATSLWELTTLLSHYHPLVTQVARGILNPDKAQPLPSKDVYLKYSILDSCLDK